MYKHMILMNSTICVKCRSVLHIVSYENWVSSWKEFCIPQDFEVIDARQTCMGISGAEGFEPALIEEDQLCA
jgi:hypothetical protein